MNMLNWETTIQAMIAECQREKTESGVDKVIGDWRGKLTQAPASLEPFQIDQIVRAVRTRLSPISSRRGWSDAA